MTRRPASLRCCRRLPIFPSSLLLLPLLSMLLLRPAAGAGGSAARRRSTTLGFLRPTTNVQRQHQPAFPIRRLAALVGSSAASPSPSSCASVCGGATATAAAARRYVTCTF